MQAIFRFNGSEEIVVSNSSAGVLLEVIESHPATELEREADAKSHASDPCSSYIDSSGYFRRVAALIPLSKSGARSVASAMMQAAAEL